MMIVSACLAGVKCRYDGKNNKIDSIEKLVADGKAIPLCPEVLGGLAIPRIPAEICIVGRIQKVINRDGIDVSENFISGAEKTLEICKKMGVETAILKSKSPSCGSKNIYDGTFSRVLIEGKGITAKLLEENGIKVIDELEAEAILN